MARTRTEWRYAFELESSSSRVDNVALGTSRMTFDINKRGTVYCAMAGWLAGCHVPPPHE